MGALVSILSFAAMAGFLSLPFFTAVDDQPDVHFNAKNPAQLDVLKSDDSDALERVSFKTLLETRCKSLFTPFRPVWWLPNGHWQTLYCVVGDFSKQDPTSYRRTYLHLHDGGTLGLDFAPLDQSAIKPNTPIVVVQHGLTGGSHESYVRAILSRACLPTEEGGLGYRAVVINFRGCAGVPITSPLLYSAGHTDDTRQALRYIAYLYPDAPILGIGFSLGANVLTRYLGEEKELSRVHAACVLGCPWDLRQNSEGLSNSFTGKYIYSKAMARNLLRLLKRHSHAMLKNPDHYVAKACEKALKLKHPTIKEFDDIFTSIAGGPSPIFPFRNANEYYTSCSSHKIVNQIRVPFLAINAVDDPIVRHVPMDGGGNSLVAMVLTKGGGHLAWFQAGSQGQVDRWTTKPVLEWLKLMGRDVVHHPQRRGSSIYMDDSGILRERGKEHLGCTYIEGGESSDVDGDEYSVLRGL